MRSTLRNPMAWLVPLLLCGLVWAPFCVADETPAPDPMDEEGNDPAAVKRVPAPAGPSGMAYVPGGVAHMGSSAREIRSLTQGRSANIVSMFMFETPVQNPTVEGYFMDRKEVTNAQYQRFLESAALREITVGDGAAASLDAIAGAVLGLSEKERKQDGYWRMLYNANREAILAGLTPKLQPKVVRDAAGEVDHEATAEALRYEPLPKKMELRFYSMRPPRYWPSMQPDPELANHPVRYVNYLDARKFAEWAGKHIPTELEWEYAARGPQGLKFPWGMTMPANKQEGMQRANVNAFYVDKRTYLPTTTPVGSIAGGLSWCGVYDLVGNVAEWTSSWFEQYPSPRALENNYTKYANRTIKVIRGGACKSQEPAAYRPASRNFVGNGPKGRPYPINAFEYVGFRCAYYPQAGRNQLEPIMARSKRAFERRLAADRFLGAVTEDFAEAGSTPDNSVYVLGPSRSIVIIPMKRVLWSEENVSDEWEADAWKNGKRFLKQRDWKKHSKKTTSPRLLLGVIHVDVPLEEVDVPKPLTEKEREKARSRSGLRRAPATIKGSLPQGTYLLTYWHERLALCSPSLEFRGFISPVKEPRGGPYALDVLAKADALPANALSLDTLDDRAAVELYVPVGGRKVDEMAHVIVKFALKFEAGLLDEIGSWRQGLQRTDGTTIDLPKANETILPPPPGIEKAEPPAAEEEEEEDDGAWDDEPAEDEEDGEGEKEGDDDAAKPSEPDNPQQPEDTPPPADKPGGDE